MHGRPPRPPHMPPQASGLNDVTAFSPRMPPIIRDDRSQLGDLPVVVSYPMPPRVDVARPATLMSDQAGQFAEVEHPYAKALTMWAMVSLPAETNVPLIAVPGAGARGGFTPNPATTAADPFAANAIPATSLLSTGPNALPANLSQSIVVVGFFRHGHQDSMIEILADLPLGQIVRVQAMGSMFLGKARLTTRYYPKFGGPAIFSWFVPANGNPFVRNAIFDDPPVLSVNGSAPPGPLMVMGFVGEGFSAPVPPSRVFSGWVDAAAPQNTIHQCPVPKGAQTVFLSCDATNANNDPAVGGAFQGVRLQFNMLTQDGSTVTRRRLNQPANVTVPLMPGCNMIEVCNIDVPGAGQAVPFDLLYDVGY